MRSMLDDVRIREVTDDDVPVFFEQQDDRVATEMADFPGRDREAHDAHWRKIRADASVCARNTSMKISVPMSNA